MVPVNCWITSAAVTSTGGGGGGMVFKTKQQNKGGDQDGRLWLCSDVIVSQMMDVFWVCILAVVDFYSSLSALLIVGAHGRQFIRREVENIHLNSIKIPTTRCFGF